MVKPVIGLVGGVGAGKSVAAAELAALGWVVIDADVIGHELLKCPDVRRRVVEIWGEGILDGEGEVDRSALAAVVFGRPREMARLNSIMHPRIRRRMERALALARRRGYRLTGDA